MHKGTVLNCFELRVPPHGIFTAGGAFVPTQEKKKKKKLANWQIGKFYESAQTP